MSTMTKPRVPAPHSKTASPPTAGAGSAVATGALVRALEETLAGLITEHEALAELARAQRGAIGSADGAGLERITREQRERVGAIAALDMRRHELAAELGARFGVAGRGKGVGGGGGMTISVLAAAVPGGGGERLRGLAERLGGVLRGLRGEHEVVRSAAETVFSHIDGLMQQLARRLSQTATYTRPGAYSAAPQLATALDLTS